MATGLCPRRIVLDDLLVKAAVAAGAELREGFAVDEVLVDDGVVTGIRGARKAARRGYYAYWSGLQRCLRCRDGRLRQRHGGRARSSGVLRTGQRGADHRRRSGTSAGIAIAPDSASLGTGRRTSQPHRRDAERRSPNRSAARLVDRDLRLRGGGRISPSAVAQILAAAPKAGNEPCGAIPIRSWHRASGEAVRTITPSIRTDWCSKVSRGSRSWYPAGASWPSMSNASLWIRRYRGPSCSSAAPTSSFRSPISPSSA